MSMGTDVERVFAGAGAGAAVTPAAFPVASSLHDFSTKASKWGEEDVYAQGIRPLLEQLRASICDPLQHEVSVVAWNVVYVLLKQRLLPDRGEGLCGLSHKPILGLSPIDFLFWQYNTGGIGEVWWTRGEVAKACMATPCDAADPAKRLPLTRDWVKDMMRGPKKMVPMGITMCEYCGGGHFKSNCDVIHRGDCCRPPPISKDSWVELYQMFGAQLVPKESVTQTGAFTHIVAPKPQAAPKRALGASGPRDRGSKLGPGAPKAMSVFFGGNALGPK